MKRGDIYYADLGMGIGCEQGGCRPVVIIQNDIGNMHSPTTIVAPITSKKKKQLPTHVQVGRMDGLKLESIILLEQIRSVDKSRIGAYICSLGDFAMDKIEKATQLSLDIGGKMENKETEKSLPSEHKNMVVFNNEAFGKLRTVIKDNYLWFVAKDVATALGYKNARDAVETHVEEEDKGVAKCDTLGGPQNLAVINESGMYALIFGSKLSTAKDFKHWVTSEVLPQIRKNGSFKTDKFISQEEIQGRLALIDGHEERIARLEAAMNIDYSQQKALEKEVKDTVQRILGGRYSKAYREMSQKVFAECNRDLKAIFQVVSRNDIPRIRFTEALEYIQGWSPHDETQAAINGIKTK